MADLTFYTQVEAELAATAGYDINYSLSEAKRRVAALRRKLDFAQQSDENGRTIVFNHAIVQNQLNQALAYVRANDSANGEPDVIHADFSTFGGYC